MMRQTMHHDPVRVPIRVAAWVLIAGVAWSAGAGHAVAQGGAPAAAAQDQAAPPDDSRYSFHRKGDGFVRLDSRTGQVAHCGWGQGGWSCKTVPDERAALEGEIGRLQRDNAELKKSLLSRGLDLPGGIMAEAPVAAAPVPPGSIPDPSAKEPKGPSDADLDRAFTFAKNVWRRLLDMMVDLQRDMQQRKS
jgi:hypothetical protein